MVLKCEFRTREGKPQVEQYGLDALAASAEAVVPGLGPLAAGLARLAGEAGRAVTLDAMEVLVIGRGRELLRGLVQLSLDAQAEREVRLPEVTGTDGVRRARAEPGHDRPVVTRLGEVRVRRIAYRSGVRGAGSLFPRDAVLNLPPLEYSWALQRLAQMFCRAVSYEQGHEFVHAATGVRIGKRQLEQIIAAAAADAERFCQDRNQDQAGPAGAGADRQERLPPLAISADGKGVAMLPAGAPPPHQGPGPEGPDLRQAGRDRGEERLQADGRDRLRLRRPAAGPAADPRAGHAPGPRRAARAAARGEPLVYLRHHGRPRRHHRQDLRPGRPPRP
jgi:hypothetical protein